MNVEQADVLKWAAWYSGPKFHAILTDPPYHLTGSMQPLALGEVRNENGTIRSGASRSRGFMGKTWDGGDIAFQPSTWAALAEHLLPGAFGMAFASSRGWHRLAVAIEDAGLIIHPAIFGYSYGSGFPKATRVKDRPAFEGHRYGLQALKPALEPIIVFQRPYEGRPVECITETGAGALWIEGGRVPMDNQDDYGRSASRSDGLRSAANGVTFQTPERTGEYASPSGRWPANFILSTTAAERLDEMSGERPGGSFPQRRSNNQSIYGNGKGLPVEVGTPAHDIGDSGGASRFFFRYVADALDEVDPVYYCAKASRRERDAGLEAMPLQKAGVGHRATDKGEYLEFVYPAPDGIGDWLHEQRERAGLSIKEVAKHFPSETGGITGCVWNWENEANRPTPEQWITLKRVIGFDEQYDRAMTTTQPVDKKVFDDRDRAVARNPHPTVKPITLARYLATLLLPPAEYAPRRILVPFAGAGSEMVGAMQAGWEEVTGVELEAEYAEIARARLEYWANQKPAQIEMVMK